MIRISDQIYDVMTTPRLIKETDFNKLLTKHKLTADELLNFLEQVQEHLHKILIDYHNYLKPMVNF